MKSVRITAMAVHVHQDLIDRFENPMKQACSIRIGQSWISLDAQCPDGFCSSAWMNLQPFVQTLSCGGRDLFDGWMKDPASAMISCNDGFRPVSFYLETID